MRGRTGVALPTGAVTGAGDGNRLNTAEHQENDLDRAPAPSAGAGQQRHPPATLRRCLISRMTHVNRLIWRVFVFGC